jgi:hypothetical protein
MSEVRHVVKATQTNLSNTAFIAMRKLRDGSFEMRQRATLEEKKIDQLEGSRRGLRRLQR